MGLWYLFIYDFFCVGVVGYVVIFCDVFDGLGLEVELGIVVWIVVNGIILVVYVVEGWCVGGISFVVVVLVVGGVVGDCVFGGLELLVEFELVCEILGLVVCIVCRSGV